MSYGINKAEFIKYLKVNRRAYNKGILSPQKYKHNLISIMLQYKDHIYWNRKYYKLNLVLSMPK